MHVCCPVSSPFESQPPEGSIFRKKAVKKPLNMQFLAGCGLVRVCFVTVGRE
jgi:hypothetical protein